MEGASAEYKVAYNCELYTVGTLGTRYYGFALPKGKSVFPTLIIEGKS